MRFTLQEQAGNAAKQTPISALMSSPERAKAKYDDAVSALHAKKGIMAKNIYRVQMTVDQRAKALHSDRAELCTHDPTLSLDPDTLLLNYKVYYTPDLYGVSSTSNSNQQIVHQGSRARGSES